MDSTISDAFDRMIGHIRAGTTDEADSILRVPVKYFTDRDHLNKELEVFRRQPLVAAMSSEIPESGSFVTRNILGVPLLITRRKDGKASVMRNMCRHRGAKVELEEKGKRPFFVCSYHGWSYGGDGRLRGVPFEKQLGELDRSCNSLHILASEERHGIIWFALHKDTDLNIAEYFGEADAKFAAYNVEDTVIFMEKHIKIGVNWKIVMDGAIDVLHPQFLHPSGVGKLVHTGSNLWNDYGLHGQSFSARKRLVDKIRAGENVEMGWRYLAGNMMVFPNSSLIPTPDHIEYWNVWPDLDDPARSTVHIRFLVSPEKLNDEIAARINRSWEILEQAATEEDFPIEETIQENSLAYPVGEYLYGKSEAPCQHLHKVMARQIDALPV